MAIRFHRASWTGACLGSFLVISVVCGGGFLWMRGEFDRMMYVPRRQDHERMAKELANRFGSKVTLLKVPFVDRDVTGYVGVVRLTSGMPLTTYQSNGFVFSFEARKRRVFCIMAPSLARVDTVKDQFARRRNIE